MVTLLLEHFEPCCIIFLEGFNAHSYYHTIMGKYEITRKYDLLTVPLTYYS